MHKFPRPTFPIKSNCFLTETALSSKKGSCSRTFVQAAPWSCEGCQEHLRQSLQRSTEHHSLPTNKPTKTHSDFLMLLLQPAFPSPELSWRKPQHAHAPACVTLTQVAWLCASVQAVGATVSLLRAHLRLARVEVNQCWSMLLQLCEGKRICWHCPRMLEGLLWCREVAAEIWPPPCQALCAGLKRACRCAKKWII